MALQEQALPLPAVGPHTTGNYRSDHLLVAEMVERGSRVLDVGCGDGDLLQPTPISSTIPMTRSTM